MIAVSACLAGIACRYDGKDHRIAQLEDMVRRAEALAICPEVLGGLPIPRDPCEIRGSQVISCRGRDCTFAYRKGAEAALKQLQEKGITLAVLKARSPACGRDWIYDGSFTKTLIRGSGIAASLFEQHGIRVLTEEEWKEKERENNL